MKRFFVYYITNLVNDKKYVGQTYNPKRRWKEHCAFYVNNRFYAINKAILKYGKENFKFEILEEFQTLEEALKFETWWIDYFGTIIDLDKGYNMTWGGENGFQSEEVRKKMSKNHSDVSGEKNPMFGTKGKLSPNWGRKHSEETKEKIRLGNIGKNKGKITSKETREKIGNAGRGRKHSPETIEKMKRNHHLTEKGRKIIIQKSSGENNPGAKLKDYQIIEIFDLFYNQNKNKAYISSFFGINLRYITQILQRKRWKHIQIPFEFDISRAARKILKKVKNESS